MGLPYKISCGIPGESPVGIPGEISGGIPGAIFVRILNETYSGLSDEILGEVPARNLHRNDFFLVSSGIQLKKIWNIRKNSRRKL